MRSAFANGTRPRTIGAAILVCGLLALGCSKTGTIAGMSLSDCHSAGDSVALSVELENGQKVNAGRGKDNNAGIVTGGQKVRVKKVTATKSGEECWEVVEWIK